MTQYPALKKVITSILAIMCISGLHAQTITPDAINAVPVQTGNTPAYKPSDYTVAVGNYIRIYQPQEPTSDATYVTSASRTVDQVNVSTQYFDGLGRPLQTVSWQASPDKKDIVAPVVYDNFGREAYKFLPYTSPTASTSGNPGQFKMNPFSEQSIFYTSTYKTEQPAIANEKYFYSKTNFEPSPLNRVTETYAPGNSWAGSEGGSAEKKVTVKYLINTRDDDAVRIWHIDFNSAIADNINIPYTDANDINDTYADGQLYKNVTIDEAGNAVVEYKDKEGQVILKKVQIGTIASDYSGYSGFLCTYYVYDDLNQLRFVIPPKAVAILSQNSWVIDSSPSGPGAELCFRYEYDYRQRMIAKKVPGAGWVYMVYDVRDRLAFSQDANMEGKHQWMYTLYDDLNRPVQTGIMNYSGNRETLQSLMPTASSSSTTTNTGTGQPVNPADLYINGRENGRGEYKATTSIVFDNGFNSEDNASFTAEIVTEPADNFSDENVTVNTAYTPPGATLIPLTYTYYDNYDAATKSYSSVNNSKLDAGGNPYPETLPSQKSTMTKGMVTVTKIRVIEDPNNLTLGKWLETDNFYDDKGRVIQVQSTNYKGGNDIVTSHYDFTGKVVSTYLVHNNTSGNVSNLRVLTSMLYDHEGRLKKITKKINDDDANKRVIATNTYDALGKLKEKQTGQKSVSNTDPLEDDNYNYNIRGWLKDINWYSNSGSYASQMNSTNNKWFSMDLSYDWGFDNNASQYNGNISGTRWKTAGDGEERAYGFAYDKANRLLKGDFTQNNGGWATDPVVDFSMQIGDGVSTNTYDENGNIIKMSQKGILGAVNGPVDDLTYHYFTASNKLSAVDDPTADTRLGDFTDKNTSGNDYGYDKNGNLITDLNKRLNGSTGNGLTSGGAITYNFLNLPSVINVKNADGSSKGTITYIYDATGNKLEKRTNETAIAKQTITSYLGGFIYENNLLQFFSHEEGRIRYRPDNNTFVYDYFLKDHLGNVRMVLTDEQKQDQYPAATFEDATIATEQLYFDNVDVQRTARPGAFYTSTSNGSKVQLLRKSVQSKGAGELLKVMAGDKLDIKVDYYIPTATTNNNTANGLNTIINALASIIDNNPATIPLHGGGSTITDNLDNSTPFTNFLAPQNGSAGTTLPKAYLNIVFFDEQFKFVSENSEAVQVTTEGSGQTIYRIEGNAKVAPKNGFVYIYVSNESDNLVYFDNLQVTHERGPLLEETHYYPFGLTMAGISDKAMNFGTPENKYLYNGKELQHNEFSDNSGLELYDFGARMQDPQLGRFSQVDPIAEKYYSQSQYVFSLNNPVLFNDIDGRDVDPTRLKGKDNISAWKNLLSTKDGYKLVAQFMHKGQQIKITIGGKTTVFSFNKEGARAKDNLVLVSSPTSEMSPEGHGDAGMPREGLTREYERNSYEEIGDDKNYDIKKGVTYLVNLDQGRNEEESTNTLVHELTVHVESNVQRVQRIENKTIDGTLKPGTVEYLKQLETITTSGNKDHQNLGQGENKTYQNISAQLDKLKNTNQYLELYKEDVKQNK